MLQGPWYFWVKDVRANCFCPSLRPWQTRTHCCGYIVADTNVSPFARSRNICCGHKFCVRGTKMFLILFRNILCPQQMFPSLRSPRNIMGNNVSATMCPRLPGPLLRAQIHMPSHASSARAKY